MRNLYLILVLGLFYNNSWAQTKDKVTFKKLPSFLIANKNYNVVIQKKDWIATVRNDGQLCIFFQKKIENVWYMCYQYETVKIYGFDVIQLPVDAIEFSELHDGVKISFDFIIKRKGHTTWVEDYSSSQLYSVGK